MVIYDCKNMKQEFILKKNPDKTCSKKQKLHYGKFDSYIHQIWKMTFAMCILESGSTFDHSGVVQKDKSARWLQDDKTLVCTKSLYISSLQHKKHHHHLFWIFLALLTFWQTKNSIHLPMRKMWENLPVVWQKRTFFFFACLTMPRQGKLAETSKSQQLRFWPQTLALAFEGK